MPKKMTGQQDKPTTSRRGAVQTHAPSVEFEQKATGAPPPRIPVLPPFVYSWHPEQWHVMHGLLVPILCKRRLQEGVQRVQRTKDGRWMLGDLRTDLERKGHTILPYGAGPGGNYMAVVKTLVGDLAKGGELADSYIPVHAEVYPGSDRITGREVEYAEWCASLVPEHIPPCPLHVAEQLLEKEHTTLARYEEKLGKGETSFKKDAERCRKNVAVLESYVDGYESAVEASPANLDIEG